MHQIKKKNSWCTSRGPHALKLANVTTNPCPMWPHYISYAIKLRTQLPFNSPTRPAHSLTLTYGTSGLVMTPPMLGQSCNQ